MDLSGKIILVTGAAQGIGEAIARLCAARGATVVLMDQQGEAAGRVAADIRAGGGAAEAAQADVRDDAAVAAVFAGVRERHGRLDALICAAGVLKGAYEQPEELSIDDWDLVLDVNVKGIFLCAKYATSLLEASGRGVLILISSGGGVRGPSSSLAYGASKAGVHGLGLTMEGRLAPRGIRVNVVCPGQIATEMKLSVIAAEAERAGRPKEEAFDEARLVLGSADGVAKVIAFLASPEADYVRGTLFTR
ncbi:MAG TPA: SDR family NAD(P)-dependent oxidoreductase [Thermomicrobiales bacterium]